MTEDSDRLSEKIDALDRLTEERFTARDKAIDTLAAETKQVRAQSNEWRGSLNDLSNTKVDRETFKALEQKVDLLREEIAQTRGQGKGSTQAWGVVFAVGGALTALVGVAIAAVAILSRGG